MSERFEDYGTMRFKKVMLFVGLTFLVSWSMAGLFFALGGKWGTTASLVMAGGYMFVPMVIAVIVQKFIYRERLKEPLGISFKLNKWFLMAWLLPLIIALACLGVSLLLPGVEYSPSMEGLRERLATVLTEEQLEQVQNSTGVFKNHPILMGVLLGLVAGVTINAVAGFGEELGWRGLMQRELGCIGFWKSSAVIGVIWGVWHWPIILKGHDYPQHPVIGVFMIVVLCALLAPIFSYVRLRANSVIAAAIIHGSFNATAGISIMMVKGGNDLTVGVFGLAGFTVLVIVNLGILIYDRFLSGKTYFGRVNL
jgi:membrane protease YdiL (CAAX protease family)